jgi:DNA-binding NarL/FixJ family response regulator
MAPIRIVLADDHTLLRAGLHALLNKLPGIEVVGEAATGREALRLVQVHQPDLVLMDIAMPDMNGLEAATCLARDFPRVRVMMLSMHATEEHVQQALRAGVAGYLLKDAALAELELAVTAVARGETYLSPAISKHVVSHIRRDRGEISPLDVLTPRQREILRLIAEGHSTKRIAQRLQISVKTVETHRVQLMNRLDVHEVAGLVRLAIRTGLVSPG